jgi:hypothetical protein
MSVHVCARARRKKEEKKRGKLPFTCERDKIVKETLNLKRRS